MATIETVELKSGPRYKVKWREARAGIAPTVSFLDLRRAQKFEILVEAHGNAWPPAEVLIAAGFDDTLDTPSAPPRPDVVEAISHEYADITLVEFCRRYLAAGTKRGAGDDSVRGMETYIRLHIAPFFKGMRLVDVHRAQLRDWQKYMLDKGRSASTVANVRGTLLNPVMERAMMRGENGEPALRDYNPFTGLPVPRKKRYVRPMLHDADEVEVFLKAAADVDADAHDLLLCAIGTGLRWGEVIGLAADAVTFFADLSGGVLEVRQVGVKRHGRLPEGMPRFHLRDETKTPTAVRVVPFGVRVARMLAGRPATGAQLMFTNPDDGLEADMWNALTFYKKFLRPIQDLAMARGLPRRVTPHGLRKTWINNLYEAQVNPVTTAATAGHIDAVVALHHYTQATTRGHDDVRTATGRLLGA